ncbi:phage major capsid protein [Micrococcus luteus]|uniref:phage major capsid protein n=1 Tax=Micrococcus TaxID=1269 RepID=UPI000BD3F20D|nr:MULTISPECIES: phage major capsid protein [Micrococcus]MCV7506614.1 phage major capsid protein [Micrococcus luteus]MCV7547608.1 phage major capsid protein [Micrococcus luteus]MCV7579439.1 phage major capsid protein [Micrococcus luteus]MCV7619866.1 phage major capsid protein [Micrococcus luteus]MCV7633447.1 phage major capsid protein [Micrococcus luteus]
MVETTATNPELLQEQVARILIQPLEAASVVLAAGPRIFDTASPLRIPKLVSSTEPSWIGEGELIPEHDVDFDEVTLMPTNRKSVKTLIRFTNELLRQSVIGLDSVLKERLVSDVARKIDDAFLTGDGADGSVTGIVNQPGVQTAVLDASEPDSLLDALALAHAAEVAPNRWFLSGADFFSVRKIKDTSGKYVLESDLTTDATHRLFGVPVTVTNKLPAGTAVLANMAEVAVARDTNPTVKILDQRYAEFDEQAIRVTARYDLGLLRPEGVVVLKSAVAGA